VTRHAARRDAGMVTIWTAVVTVACLLMVGLVLDSGAVLRSRSRSFDLAGAAARAGIQELDQVELTEGRVVLDETAARQAANEYLAAHNAVGDVAVEDLEVHVTVRDTVRLQLLRPASITVTETATARAAQGAP
jgi:Flp pilus assembly protein TadG